MKYFVKIVHTPSTKITLHRACMHDQSVVSKDEDLMNKNVYNLVESAMFLFVTSLGDRYYHSRCSVTVVLWKTVGISTDHTSPCATVYVEAQSTDSIL